MKKVRLFAVAAAMGMFAATVNAAPTVTKEAYVATWGTMDEIVRAEFGGKVVLPTANISVTKETRSTDTKYAPTASNPYGTGDLALKTCYEGFTDKVVSDSNLDGIADYKVLFWNVKDNGASAGATPDAWYHDEYKYFPSVKTALYYMGMTSNGYGARFLAAGQEAKNGYVMIDRVYDSNKESINYHGWYDNTVEGKDKLIDVLVKGGQIKLVSTTDVRDNTILSGFELEAEFDKAAATNGTIVTKGEIEEERVTVFAHTAPLTDRYAEDEVKDAILNFALTGDDTLEVVASNVVYTYKTGNDAKEKATYSTGFDISGTEVELDNGDLATDGVVLLVKQDRYGAYEIVDAYKGTDTTIEGSDLSVYTATTDTFRNTVGKINIYEIDYRSTSTSTSLEPSRISVVSPVTHGNNRPYSMVWSDEAGTFVKTEAAGAAGAPFSASGERLNGLYRVNTVANTSDKILLDFDMDKSGAAGMSSVVAINSVDKVIAFEDVNGDEFEVPYVTIGSVKYPAFANETAVLDFLQRMAGIYNPSNAVFDLAADDLSGSTRTWADGTTTANYVPTNRLDHYKAKQCTYRVGEGTAVDASSIVITSNADAVNTSQYGVQTLTLTAKVGETVVGTKDVKVVIAPKYVREYKNGKVTSLKAYHLNGNLYSHTTFDYAKKTSTAVFYAQDGVTAVETQTSAIK